MCEINPTHTLIFRLEAFTSHPTMTSEEFTSEVMDRLLKTEMDLNADGKFRFHVHEAQLPQVPCFGCGEKGHDLIEGEILPRFMPGTPATVYYCAGCWEIVDGADPVTGAYGAAACDVRRSTAPMGTAQEL
jgi:hypothetical protein